MENRNEFYDVAKGLGIILVVMGHLEYISEPLRYFIVSFHMPLFFVISGMLFYVSKGLEQDRRVLVRKKLLRIGLPYVSFSIAYLIIEVLYGNLTGTFSKWTLIQDAWQFISLYGISVLWFLPAMFFGMLMFYNIARQLRKIRELLVVTIVMIQIAYALSFLLSQYQDATVYNFVLSELYYPMAMAVRSIFACFYFAVGYIAGAFISEIENDIPAPAKLGIAAVLFAAVWFLSQENGAVDIHFMIFGNPFMYIFNSLAGSVAVLLVSSVIADMSGAPLRRVLCYYGRNSLTVMATHINFYILYGSIITAMHLMEYIHHAKGYLFCPLIVIIVFLVEIPVIEVINRFLPCFTGKIKINVT